MTMRLAPKERGAEPDECYAVGAKKDAPDLAIEVVWTSGGLDMLESYRGLGVVEVWVWEEHRISVHALRMGAYVALEASEILPDVDLRFIEELVSRAEPQTDAVRRIGRNSPHTVSVPPPAGPEWRDSTLAERDTTPPSPRWLTWRTSRWARDRAVHRRFRDRRAHFPSASSLARQDRPLERTTQLSKGRRSCLDDGPVLSTGTN
jgi:hypothetical protein